MTDDIVTRLRIACRQEGAEYCGECQPCQAADEIERLQAEVYRLTLLANLWESEFNAAVDALIGKAMRDEQN